MLIIGGATATGKSGLAIEVAKKLNGEIISADSMQIYKHMNIGTAKVTEMENQGIVHHLIDIIEPEDTFSVAQYTELAKQAIDKIKAKNKVPIIAGGTGLYINSLIYKYSLSAQNADLREELAKELELCGKEHMYERLLALDPQSANITHCNNTKRVLRALEVFLLTGKSIALKDDKKQALPHILYAINTNRQIMYNIINKRVDLMFEIGLLDEVDYLVKVRKLSFENQSMQAIGYKEFNDYYNNNNNNNNKTLEEVKNDIKQHTRNYAKRQITWFKSIPSCKWLDNTEGANNIDLICSDYYKYLRNLEV